MTIFKAEFYNITIVVNPSAELLENFIELKV